MALSDEDKAYIRNIVKDSIGGQNQPADKNGKEFLFHRHDALWEHMRSKESRLIRVEGLRHEPALALAGRTKCKCLRCTFYSRPGFSNCLLGEFSQLAG